MKKKLEENLIRADLGEDYYEDLLKARNEPTLEKQTITSLWDYDHNQYPRTKYPILRNLLKQRLKETQNEIEIQKIKKVLEEIKEE